MIPPARPMVAIDLGGTKPLAGVIDAFATVHLLERSKCSAYDPGSSASRCDRSRRHQGAGRRRRRICDGAPFGALEAFSTMIPPARPVVAIDLGGTKALAGVVDAFATVRLLE